VAEGEPSAPSRLLCPVYSLFGNAACLSKVLLLNISRKKWTVAFLFPDRFCLFYDCSTVWQFTPCDDKLPTLHLHTRRDWLVNYSIFSHSCERWTPLPEGIGTSHFSIGPYFPERCLFLPARPTKAGRIDRLTFQDQPSLFCLRCFSPVISCDTVFMPCSVNLYSVPARGRTGFDIRTVSIISRTVRVQIKIWDGVAIGFFNPIASFRPGFQWTIGMPLNQGVETS